MKFWHLAASVVALANSFIDRACLLFFLLVYSLVVFPLFSLYGYLAGGDLGLQVAARTHRRFYKDLFLDAWRRASWENKRGDLPD